MIYLTSDPHGNFHKHFGFKNFKEGKDLTEEDLVIVTGDFSGLFYNKNNPEYKADMSRLNWLKEKPWTTLFVDGNHENFNLIEEYPEEKIFGGMAHKINEKLYHLKRGEVFNIEGKKFFVFGGAETTNKETFDYRGKRKALKEGIDYWNQEICSEKEKFNAIANLKKHNNKVDYVLTHTCPSSIISLFENDIVKKDPYRRKLDPVSLFLDTLTIDFSHWYFGHFHISKKINEKYTMLYKDFEKLP